MNLNNLNEAWAEIVAQIKTYDGVNPAQIDAFFSRLQPQAIAEGFLVVTTDTEFIKQQIEMRFEPLIVRACKDLTGVDYLIEIGIDQSSAPKYVAAEPQQKPVARFDEGNGNTQQRNPVEERHLADHYYQTANDRAADMFVDASSAADQFSSLLTFENFVVGDSNKLAYSMAVRVAEDPGKPALNPLFIYGRSGLGKTHLLRSIQNYIRETNPSMKTRYVDSSELVNEYTAAAMAHDKDKQSYQTFQQRYIDSDVLLIDDVQYFQGKEGTLDIVFQLFKKLLDAGKQIVLSADRAPKMIDIDERYYSRFGAGGVIDIKPPETETKLGIVKAYLNEYRRTENRPDLYIPEEIQVYIAETSSPNVRELKSAVTKIIGRIELYGNQGITLTEVKEMLEDHFSSGVMKKLTVQDIQTEVEKFYRVSHADIVGQKRSKDIMYARQVAIYLCRQLLDIPYDGIGKRFNRDHSTVMYSVQKIETLMKKSRSLQEEVEVITKNIREN